MSLNSVQYDALLDVFEQCRMVTHAYGQSLAHYEHRTKHSCTSECTKVGNQVAQALTLEVTVLERLFKLAVEDGIPEDQLDVMLSRNLPETVFDYFYGATEKL